MRRWKRQRAGYVCVVEFPDGPHQCRIKNLGVGGAFLSGLPSPPATGELLTVSWKSGKLRRCCRVVWAKADEAGVQFIASPSD